MLADGPFFLPLQAAPEVPADAILVRDFSMYQPDNRSRQLVADIRFDYYLNQYLRDSLQNGITLQNEIRFDLVWHSDWWWNKTETLDRIVVELKYNDLSRRSISCSTRKPGKAGIFRT
ncbi:MAG: DUF4390 domain-containing protein [Thiolinea sp.]